MTKRQASISVDPYGVPVLEVEAILKSRRCKGSLEFLVKWMGYDDLENSWQPLCDVVNAWELVLEFYRREPGALRPTRGEMSLFQLEGM